MSDRVDVFVIGAGVAGLTAAEEAARRGLGVAIAEELMFGGLVVNVNHLSPAMPGLPAAGSDLAADAMTRVADLGVNMLFEAVTAVEPLADGGFSVTTPSQQFLARSVIVASGARMRSLGVPGEAEFEHRGISRCADCDAPMVAGEVAVVVGGGDSALQESLVLADFCSTVHLVHRDTAFSARPDFVAAIQAQPKVSVHFQTVVDAIEDTDGVTGVKLRSLATGEASVLACKGVFPFVGLQPHAPFLPAAVQMAGGAIAVDAQRESSLKNLFAIGAVRQGYGGAVTDAMEDARAAVAALRQHLQHG